jgi:uncharacterized protein (TIRG00374 family)
VNARAAGRAIRVLVAVTLTAYVLWRSDAREVVEALASADVSYVLGAVALVVVDRALMAWRWIGLLCVVDRAERPPMRTLMEIFFVSTFLGTFLPASVGGDAVRAYSLTREQVAGGDAAASVFMDRMLGLASLLVLAPVSLVLVRDLAANAAVLAALALTTAACALTVALIFSERVARWCARVVSGAPVAVLRRVGHAMIASVRRYAWFHRRLGAVLASSVAVQVLRIAQAYLLGRALGIEAGLSAYFAFIPLILLIMLLPVTINGLGTSQAAFVWFFAEAGVPGALAFALSVLFVGLGIVGNLPGGVLYAIKPTRG